MWRLCGGRRRRPLAQPDGQRLELVDEQSLGRDRRALDGELDGAPHRTNFKNLYDSLRVIGVVLRSPRFPRTTLSGTGAAR